MEESLARAIIRILGFVTALVGVIMTSTSTIMLTAMRGTIGSSRGMDSLNFAVVCAYGLVIVWGLGVYKLSPWLAKHIAA